MTTHTEKKKPARRICLHSIMTREKLKTRVEKKMLELETLQASIIFEDKVSDCFHIEYERLQDLFQVRADTRLFLYLAECRGAFPTLEILRAKAQEIAAKALPFGMQWDWKWYLRFLVKEKELPAFLKDLYNLEEQDNITRWVKAAKIDFIPAALCSPRHGFLPRGGAFWGFWSMYDSKVHVLQRK